MVEEVELKEVLINNTIISKYKNITKFGAQSMGSKEQGDNVVFKEESSMDEGEHKHKAPGGQVSKEMEDRVARRVSCNYTRACVNHPTNARQGTRGVKE